MSWEFIIGIFLSIFKRDKWLDGLKYINQQDIKDTNVWSNFDNTCLSAKIISTVFKNEKSFICSKPLSVNLIGERIITLKSKTIEEHLYKNETGTSSIGIGLFKLGVSGYSQNRLDFSTLQPKDFHPIGKLNTIRVWELRHLQRLESISRFSRI